MTEQDPDNTTSAVDLDEVVIRPVGLRDLPAVQALYVKQSLEAADPFTSLLDNETLVAWNLRRLRQQLIVEERYIARIALRGERAIGYAAALIEQQAPVFQLATYGSISELYVEPDFRRQGYATRLLDDLQDGLTAMGVEWVEFTVAARSDAARRLAEQRGYTLNTLSFGHRLAGQGASDNDAEGAG